LWRSDDQEFREYTTLIASPERVLAIYVKGKLTLVDARSPQLRKLSELQLLDGEEGLYSHAAIVGSRLYVRGSKQLLCVELDR